MANYFDLDFRCLIKLNSIFLNDSTLSFNCTYSSAVIYFKSLDNSIWHSNSQADPMEICRKLLSWPWLLLPQPSAILEAIDTLHRRIWEVRPYTSSFGKDLVTAYTDKAISCALCQISNFLKLITAQKYIFTK